MPARCRRRSPYPTRTGSRGRRCSFAYDERVTRQLNLEWGVYPFAIELHLSAEELVRDALARTKELGSFEPGTTVVLTAGRSTGTPGATSLVMVREIP